MSRQMDRDIPQNLILAAIIVGLLLIVVGIGLQSMGKIFLLSSLVTCVGFGIVLAAFGSKAGGSWAGWTATGAGAMAIILFLVLQYYESQQRRDESEQRQALAQRQRHSWTITGSVIFVRKKDGKTITVGEAKNNDGKAAAMTEVVEFETIPREFTYGNNIISIIAPENEAGIIPKIIIKVKNWGTNAVTLIPRSKVAFSGLTPESQEGLINTVDDNNNLIELKQPIKIWENDGSQEGQIDRPPSIN